jgi:NAD(P) transhydrogenase subunit alpha
VLQTYKVVEQMIIGVPKEIAPGERRVALVPDTVVKLIKSGHEILVQEGAGLGASIPDTAYLNAGARIVDLGELYSRATVIVKVARPMLNPDTGIDEAALLHPDMLLIGCLAPLGHPEYVRSLAASGVTAFAMEAIPRITRAQAMDSLSSQSSIAGYKAVLLAASALPKFFPMLTTAAGTIPPARVLVLGAGVAGLQAIATARRLGAVVSAYDTRAAVGEQVQSLGAKFLKLDLDESGEGSGGYARELSPEAIAKQREFLAKHAAMHDVIITTALVPGRRAPLLITADAVRGMAPGSVIVDLAAEAGGNCEWTESGMTVVKEGVTLIGETNLPASMPLDASRLYSRNIQTVLEHLLRDGAVQLDMDDEITRAACICTRGRVTHMQTVALLESTVAASSAQ